MLRITGGELRGRTLQTPSNLKTRPTQARLRQALFNSIQFQVSGSRVLDLFAGSGALGFEAISRGASHVVFVESAPSALKALKANMASLKVEAQVKILAESLPAAISRFEKLGPFDIVLADPPYEEGWETRLLEEISWEKLLAPGGVFCLEWGIQKSKVRELPDSVLPLTKVREKEYGDSMLTTYFRPDAEHANDGPSCDPKA